MPKSSIVLMRAYLFQFLLIVTAALSLPCLADADLWTSTGPFGANVLSMAIAPQSPSTLYAGTWGVGVFKSTDAGASWKQVGLPGSIIQTLAIVPLSPNRIYAGDRNSGIYRSDDGGATWSSAGLRMAEVNCIAADPASESTVYVASNAGVYRSDDAGANWALLVSWPSAPSVDTILIDPLNSSTLYVLVANMVFKSLDKGVTWVSKNAGLSPTGISTLALSLKEPSILLAASSGSLFRSTNGGDSWQAIGPQFSSNIIALWGCHGDPQRFFLSTYGNFFITMDGGETWDPRPTINSEYVQALAIDPLSENTLYAGTNLNIQKSLDEGATWFVADTGCTNVDSWAFAASWANSQVFYYSTGTELLKSDNDCLSWKKISAGGWKHLAVFPLDSNIVYAIGDWLFEKSVDGGATWQDLSAKLPVWYNLYLIAVHPANPSLAFAGGYDGMFITKDGGETWEKNLWLTGGQYPSMQFDPTNPSIAYVSVNPGIYKTTDSGETWQQIGTNISLPYPGPIAIDPMTPQSIYLGVNGPQGPMGLYMSTDGGANFSYLSLSGKNISSLAMNALLPGTLYAGTDAGVLQSGDGGASWSEMNEGLPSLSVKQLLPSCSTTRLHAAIAWGSIFSMVAIRVPGDCDGDGRVSIGEVQKAINMFLGTQAPTCGVDCDGNGQVSIGEVQKVINAFLGLAASC